MQHELCFNMNHTEQLIKVGTAYVDALNKLEKNHPENVACILDILDCVHPDPGYRLGVYIKKFSSYPFISRFRIHCYQGGEEPIMVQSDKLPEYDNDKRLYHKYTYELFNHLIIERSLMGAWQAYLLSISNRLPPCPSIGTEPLFDIEQLHGICLILKITGRPEPIITRDDLSPSVSWYGNHIKVSSCYWNYRKGLIRETVYFSFGEDNRIHIGNYYDEILYKIRLI